MSDFQALAGVSATLQLLLDDRMDLPVGYDHGDLGVTVGPPPILEGSEDGTGSSAVKLRVNLYLYRVSENAFLKNQEIPGHGQGSAYGHPPLSLDLYYLLTAYGTTKEEKFDNETLAHFGLGSAMRVLHDHPVIAENMTTKRVVPQGAQILHPSLRGDFEEVKLSLDPINLEDLSKVWTALKGDYRLSAAYKVSVVQIESETPRTYPRLVGEPKPAGPRVHALTFSSPHIRQILVRRAEDFADVERPYPYARIGDTLIIRGRNFASEATRVTLGPVEAEVAVLLDDRIELTIPDVDELQPGPQPVKVVLDINLGDPPEPHVGFESNLAVFMLVPRIAAITPDAVTLPAGGTSAATLSPLKILGSRLYHPELECLTLVGDAVIRLGAYTNSVLPKIEFKNANSDETASNLKLTANATNLIATLSGAHEGDPRLSSLAPRVALTIGTTTAPATLDFPDDREPGIPIPLADIAPLLEAGIRQAVANKPEFNEAVVLTMPNRLVILPGGTTPANRLTFANMPADLTAKELLLTAQATNMMATLSDIHQDDPQIPAGPKVAVTIGLKTATATLNFSAGTGLPSQVPVANVGPVLEAAIHDAVATDPFFKDAVVLVSADARLIVLPGGETNDRQVTFVLPDGLGKGAHPVRVRVNATESIDDRMLTIS